MVEDRTDKGIALVAVLGFLAAMSLLVISVTSAAHTSVMGATRHLARLQAQAAVESALELGIDQLVNGQYGPPPILEAAQQLETGGFTATVSARSESGKIDLNFADVTLLMGLFQAAGADADKASALASAVLDWRDADDLLHLNGAEANDYAAAGLKYAPANKPFESIDELRLVLGMTPELFACVEGDVTVYAQSASVNIDVASALVRRAAGVTAETPGGKPGATGFSVISGISVGAGSVYEVTATVDDRAHGLHRSERAVVRITGNRRAPYWTLATGIAPRGASRCASSAEAR